MHKLNILYYHYFINLLLKEELQNNIRNFLHDNIVENKFHLIYYKKNKSKFPGGNYTYDKIFITRIFPNYSIIMYDDNNTSEIFLIFNIQKNNKLKLIGFGNGPMLDKEDFQFIEEKNKLYKYEYYYGNDNHYDKFLHILLNKSLIKSKNIINSFDFYQRYKISNNLLEEYNFWMIFFKNILICKNIKRIKKKISYYVAEIYHKKIFEYLDVYNINNNIFTE